MTDVIEDTNYLIRTEFSSSFFYLPFRNNFSLFRQRSTLLFLPAIPHLSALSGQDVFTFFSHPHSLLLPLRTLNYTFQLKRFFRLTT